MNSFKRKRIRLALKNHPVRDPSIAPIPQHIMNQKIIDDWWWENINYVLYIHDSP